MFQFIEFEGLKMRLTIAVLILCSSFSFGQGTTIKELFSFVRDSTDLDEFNKASRIDKYEFFDFTKFSDSHELKEHVRSFWEVAYDSLERIVRIESIDSGNYFRNFSLNVYNTGELSVLCGFHISGKKIVEEYSLWEGDEEVKVVTTEMVQFPIGGFLVIDHPKKRVYFFETYSWRGGATSASTSYIRSIMLLDKDLFPVKRMELCNREIRSISLYSYPDKVIEKKFFLFRLESSKLGYIDDMTISDIYNILNRRIKKIREAIHFDKTITITEDPERVSAPLWLYAWYAREASKSRCEEWGWDY